MLSLLPKSQHATGLLLAVLGTTLFSFKSIVIKLAYQYQIGADQVIALRMLMSAPVYLAIFAYLHYKKPLPFVRVWQRKWLLLAAGLLGYYLASLLDLIGLTLISAQLERLILFTYPGFVMLFSWLFWRRLPGSKTLIAMLVTYLGILLVLGVEFAYKGSDTLVGGALVLISAALFAGYLILSKNGIAALGSQQFTCIAMLVASLAVAVHFAIASDATLLGLPAAAYGYVFILSLFCTVIPSLLIAAAIGRLGPQQTSILGGLGPVITAGLAVFILNEPFGWWHFWGTSLVVLGVILVATDKGG